MTGLLHCFGTDRDIFIEAQTELSLGYARSYLRNVIVNIGTIIHDNIFLFNVVQKEYLRSCTFMK